MAKRHSTSKSRFTAQIAPSWLAVIGLALSVTSMRQPRMLASAGGGQRLALNLPTWTLIGFAAAAVDVAGDRFRLDSGTAAEGS